MSENHGGGGDRVGTSNISSLSNLASRFGRPRNAFGENSQTQSLLAHMGGPGAGDDSVISNAEDFGLANTTMDNASVSRFERQGSWSAGLRSSSVRRGCWNENSRSRSATVSESLRRENTASAFADAVSRSHMSLRYSTMDPLMGLLHKGGNLYSPARAAREEPGSAEAAHPLARAVGSASEILKPLVEARTFSTKVFVHQHFFLVCSSGFVGEGVRARFPSLPLIDFRLRVMVPTQAQHTFATLLRKSPMSILFSTFPLERALAINFSHIFVHMQRSNFRTQNQ